MCLPLFHFWLMLFILHKIDELIKTFYFLCFSFYFLLFLLILGYNFQFIYWFLLHWFTKEIFSYFLIIQLTLLCCHTKIYNFFLFLLLLIKIYYRCYELFFLTTMSQRWNFSLFLFPLLIPKKWEREWHEGNSEKCPHYANLWNTLRKTLRPVSNLYFERENWKGSLCGTMWRLPSSRENSWMKFPPARVVGGWGNNVILYDNWYCACAC